MSSGHNARFSANPKVYLQTVAVMNSMSMGKTVIGAFNPNLAHKQAYLNLVPNSGGKTATLVTANYSLTPKGHGTNISCGYVPYWMEGDVDAGKELPKLLLPPGGNPKYVFTGAMNGCSLLIATDSSGNEYGVHYPNSGGSQKGFPHLGRDGLTLVKSVDYINGYGMDREQLEKDFRGTWSNVFAFFIYKDSQWKIMAQPQLGYTGGKALKPTLAVKINTAIPLIEI